MSLAEYRARRARLGFDNAPKPVAFVGPPVVAQPVPVAAPPTLVRTTEAMEADLKQIRERIDNGQCVSIDAIKKRVCKAFGLNKGDLESECRSQELVIARHISMYLCKRYSGRSFSVIGREHGNRDHATVLYAYRKVAAWLRGEREL